MDVCGQAFIAAVIAVISENDVENCESVCPQSRQTEMRQSVSGACACKSLSAVLLWTVDICYVQVKQKYA